MRPHSTLIAAFAIALSAAPASAQQPEPGKPAAALPAAGTAEATTLLETACKRMLAVGGGTFHSEEEQDPALLRGRNLPIGNDGPSTVDGGWRGDLLWGATDTDTWCKQGGRMVAKTDAGWKLRAQTLASGAAAPFTLSPPLLFAQLQALPPAAKQIESVEAGEIGGKPVAILGLSLASTVAADFALSGTLPTPAGGPMLRMGGMFGGGDAPEKTYAVDVALFVDPQTGDVLRVRAKVYEDDPVLAHVRLQFGGGDGGEGEAAAEEATTDADAAAGKPKWKKGLPDRKPGKTESLAYLKVDFKQLGAGEAPALDAAGKRWLELR